MCAPVRIDRESGRWGYKWSAESATLSKNSAEMSLSGMEQLELGRLLTNFECGAFNHSATSPRGKKLKWCRPYLAAAPQRNKSTPIAVALITGGCQFLQLAAELAIERIRTAAAQRDGKAQQPPQQHIFVT